MNTLNNFVLVANTLVEKLMSMWNKDSIAKIASVSAQRLEIEMTERISQVVNEVEMTKEELSLYRILLSLVKENLLDPLEAEFVWDKRELVSNE